MRIGNFAYFSRLPATMVMTLITRNQFNITPDGIVHKPTDAAFIPSAGDPLSGTMRLGLLVNQHPNGREYPVEDVQRIMRELWVEYVASNPERFRSKSAT